MIVVSDTSPLHYLILIEREWLLPQLYGRVVAPTAVIEELSHPQAPEPVRRWIATPPPWLETQTPSALKPETYLLGPGEAAAISLAQEIGAKVVLIDERQGAKLARSTGLLVTGTLGVLEGGATRGLVSLADSLAALERTNYHRSPTLFADLLRKHESK